MLATPSTRALDILIVEDNEADARILIEVLQEERVAHRFTVCENGVEAGQYLYRTGKYADAARPELVILDINLPIWSGLELLEKLKADSAIASIPVIVFSSSRSQRDIEKAYELRAACYVSKPSSFGEYEAVAEGIRSSWIYNLALLGPTVP
jgi:CheY-like chemotaxis protein